MDEPFGAWKLLQFSLKFDILLKYLLLLDSPHTQPGRAALCPGAGAAHPGDGPAEPSEPNTRTQGG